MPPVGPPSGLSPQLEIWGPKDFSAKGAPRDGSAGSPSRSARGPGEPPPPFVSTWPTQCVAGCMEAVQAAALQGWGASRKVVDVALGRQRGRFSGRRWQHDGVHGCSYGPTAPIAGHALFNSDPAGRSDSDRGVTYRLACVNDVLPQTGAPAIWRALRGRVLGTAQ